MRQTRGIYETAKIYCKIIYGHGIDPKILDAVKALVGVDRSYMEKLLDYIDTEYGSMPAFLDKELGVNSEAVQKLRSLYLD